MKAVVDAWAYSYNWYFCRGLPNDGWSSSREYRWRSRTQGSRVGEPIHVGLSGHEPTSPTPLFTTPHNIDELTNAKSFWREPMPNFNVTSPSRLCSSYPHWTLSHRWPQFPSRTHWRPGASQRITPGCRWMMNHPRLCQCRPNADSELRDWWT